MNINTAPIEEKDELAQEEFYHITESSGSATYF